MLDWNELDELEKAMKRELPERLTGILSKLNREGRLDELLSLMGMEDILKDPDTDSYKPPKTGTIVVLGGTEVKEKDLAAIGKSLGLGQDRFDFCLDYYETQKYDYKKLQWAPKYSLVMVGPMPHSTAGKDHYSSAVSAMEQMEGYPPVMRLGKNELKITKSDFREKLETALKKEWIIA